MRITISDEHWMFAFFMRYYDELVDYDILVVIKGKWHVKLKLALLELWLRELVCIWSINSLLHATVLWKLILFRESRKHRPDTEPRFISSTSWMTNCNTLHAIKAMLRHRIVYRKTYFGICHARHGKSLNLVD